MVDPTQKSGYQIRLSKLEFPGLVEHQGIDNMVNSLYTSGYQISPGLIIPDTLRDTVADSTLEGVEYVIKSIRESCAGYDQQDEIVADALTLISPLIVGPAVTLEKRVFLGYVGQLCDYFVDNREKLANQQSMGHLPSYAELMAPLVATQKGMIATLKGRYDRELKKSTRKGTINQLLGAAAILLLGALSVAYVVSSREPEITIPTTDESGNPAQVCPVCPD